MVRLPPQAAPPFLRHLAEDAAFQVHRLEHLGAGELGFRLAQEQETVVGQRVMEPRQNQILRVAFQVDQQVAADQQVDARNRRVGHEVVPAEDHAFAQFALEDVVVVGPLEILVEHVGGDVLDIARRVHGVPGGVQRRVVQVGRVDLHPLAEILGAELFGKQHGQRVGLLSGRAAGAPDPDVAAVALARDDPGHDLLLQHVPGIRIAEEGRDVDQHGVQQVDEFLRVRLQKAVIDREILAADFLHAAADAPLQAGPLVATKIQPPAFLYVPDQGLELRIDRFFVGHGSCVR